MKLAGKLICLLLIIISFCSCTPQRKLIYLKQDNTELVHNLQQYIYTLRSGDLLSVNVFSANEKAAQLFSASGAAYPNMSSDINTYVYGYLVNDSGNINLPLIGSIPVSGLSIDEATLVIEKRIKEYFFDAIVNIKLMNFQITVLGEVNKPGTFRVLDTKVNVLEAIALAGDLTVFGNREITLIRETSEGHSLYTIDLKDRNLASQEYFYLLPNDIIYVEPHKAKLFGFNSVPVATILSALTTLILILNFIQ